MGEFSFLPFGPQGTERRFIGSVKMRISIRDGPGAAIRGWLIVRAVGCLVK